MQHLKTILSRVLAATVLLFVTGSVFANDIVGIWEIPTEGSRCEVFDVNNYGQVVGATRDPDENRIPFLWENGVMTHLMAGHPDARNGIAWGINNSGQVAGWIHRYSGGQRGFSWENGIVTELQPPGNDPARWAEGLGINDGGQIVGDAEVGDPDGFHAFIWEVGNPVPVQELPQVNEGVSWYSGHRINNLGQTTGYYQPSCPSAWRPYSYDGDSSSDLGTIGGEAEGSGEAWGINDAGEVVGYSDVIPEDLTHATLWDHGDIIDMGTLGGDWSFAWDINNHSVATGESTDASGQMRAFMWEDGVMTDLNDLLPPDSGWVLTTGMAISDTGWVVGQGTYHGQIRRAFALLIPEPTSLLALAVGGLALLGRRQ
jgi:probable HAF family extracellular repeat protein